MHFTSTLSSSTDYRGTSTVPDGHEDDMSEANSVMSLIFFNGFLETVFSVRVMDYFWKLILAFLAVKSK